MSSIDCTVLVSQLHLTRAVCNLLRSTSLDLEGVDDLNLFDFSQNCGSLSKVLNLLHRQQESTSCLASIPAPPKSF